MTKASVLVIIQFILFAVIGGTAILVPMERSAGQWIVGGICILLGLIVGFIAIIEHGRINRGGPSALPTPNQNADLITSGLYKYIRHPIYTGVLLLAFGITIWHGHGLIITSTLFLIGLLTYKSLYEEDLLIEQYPAYVDYREHTGRFFPKIF
jgi:protein-S-isoprenylcysteine O-methyltransferase Ste14